jgi:predicted RNase H-like HicB family nuclease
MNNYSINLAWSDEDQGYIATCPEFPGLSAFGATAEAAVAEATVALGLFVKTFTGENLQLPEPQKVEEYSGQFRVRIPKSLHRQAAEMAKRNGSSLNQFLVDAIAERVGGRKVGEEILEEIRALLGHSLGTVGRMR